VRQLAKERSDMATCDSSIDVSHVVSRLARRVRATFIRGSAAIAIVAIYGLTQIGLLAISGLSPGVRAAYAYGTRRCYYSGRGCWGRGRYLQAAPDVRTNTKPVVVHPTGPGAGTRSSKH
jgi:hypothetical protein